MKKPVVYLCVGMLVLGLTACGGNNEDPMQNSESNVNNSQQNTQQTEETLMEESDAQQNGRHDGFSMVREAVREVLGENYWPDTELQPEYLEEYGLTPEMYHAFYGEIAMVSNNVDTLIVVEAKENQVEAVEEVLNNYREMLVNDTMQYPMNVGKIQASRIEILGNYICFVQLGADTTGIYGEDGNEEAVIKHCQEQNELAIEAIGKALADR